MRKMLVAALAIGMALSFSLTAKAGDLDWASYSSFLDIKLGSVPQIHLSTDASHVADVTLNDVGTGHGVDEAAGVFATTGYAVNSAAFTGLPQLTGLKLTLQAGSGDFDEGASYANPLGTGVVSGFGGTEANTGQSIIRAGGFDFLLDLSGVLGSGGSASLANVLQNAIVVTGAPFNTADVNITGLSSNIVHVPSLGVTGVAFTLNLTTVQLLTAYELTSGGSPLTNNTVTITHGFNNLASASQAGTVKMVSPFRISTQGLAGNVAGSLTKAFTFVPEPGTALLLLTGAAGLAAVGRMRTRK